VPKENEAVISWWWLNGIKLCLNGSITVCCAAGMARIFRAEGVLHIVWIKGVDAKLVRYRMVHEQYTKQRK
jgi:hypothetical protein